MSDPRTWRRRTRENRPAKRSRVALWVGLALVLVVGAWSLWQGLLKTTTGGGSGVAKNLNVLLITLDTTRADYLGCYGRASARTPNIDRLAREGTLFTRCTTCSPLTLPSHASIMTAVHPYVHGARRNGTYRLGEANITLAEALKDAGYSTQAVVGAFVLNRRFGTAQGFDVYRDVAAPARGDPMQAERKGDQVCDNALEMLRTLAPDRFFLWVHFYDPHDPYESPRVADTFSPLAYEDEIAFVDVQIGRLLDELERLDLGSRTLLVVVGDHGEDLNQHGELTHGTFLYETTLHVPFILRCPGMLPAGRTVSAQVCTIDIAPTVLELVGAPSWEHGQGVSLMPLLSADQQDWDWAAYAESFEAHAEYELSRLRSLSVDGWKYVLAPKPELYHLASDPSETRNMVAEQPDLAERLRERLRTTIATAPLGPTDENGVPTLNATEIARLESLGYAAAGTHEEDDNLSELDRFEPQGADPKDYLRYFKLSDQARVAVNARQYQQAEMFLREVVAGMPDATRPLTELAYVVARQKRLHEALELYKRALDGSADTSFARHMYVELLLQAGQWADVLAQTTVILNETPKNVFAWYCRGVALGSTGRLHEAEEYLDLALNHDPKSPIFLHAMGVLRWRQGRLTEAETYFRRALQIRPEFGPCARDLQRLQRAKRP
ncbi:MAG TPA: sulfatase-like hydrolase/transferase [Phycisphaerae bacterium]|nr:sulfatase-like hydrolase/transferase [Phycisphaerae bacterium]